MAFYVEIRTTTKEEEIIVQRIPALNEQVAELSALHYAQLFKYEPVPKTKCWCLECAPAFLSDLGELVIVSVADYDEPVQAGVFIEATDGEG